MKMKIAIIAILSVVCVQSTTAAWLAVKSRSKLPLYVKAFSNGFKGGVEAQKVKPGATSAKFKSGAHGIKRLAWQAYNEAEGKTYGPKFEADIQVPAATLTYTITIEDDNTWKYNSGVGRDKIGDNTSVGGGLSESVR